MRVAVLIPWVGGDIDREDALNWVLWKYRTEHPTWEIVLGSPEQGLSRAQSLRDAANKTDAEMLVCADADVWCGMNEAVRQAQFYGWAIPHLYIYRLSRSSSQKVLSGMDWRGLPLSNDNDQDSRPYKGHEGGTLLAIEHSIFDQVGPDPRFVDWGQEDDCWAMALRTLVGIPWRGDENLMHLWHPPQPRLSRKLGSLANKFLHSRYMEANGNPEAMTALLQEAKWPLEQLESA